MNKQNWGNYLIIAVVLMAITAALKYVLKDMLPDLPTPFFVLFPVFVSLLFAKMLYSKKRREHRYDDFIKDDKGYKKFFWKSFWISVIGTPIVAFLTYMFLDYGDWGRSILTVIISLIYSALGSLFCFKFFAVLLRMNDASMKHYPEKL